MVANKLQWTRQEREVEKEVLYRALLDKNEGRVFAIILPIAVLLHVVLLFINLPESERTLAPVQPKSSLELRHLPLTPPEPKIVQVPRPPRRDATRSIPVPDPTPEPDLAPIHEPAPIIDEGELTDDPFPDESMEVSIGSVIAPPTQAPSGPVMPGLDGVTLPTLQMDSKVDPTYPELARQARVEGNVVLQAVIRADGTVEQLTVLRCSRPNVGFEEAAIEAVSQWIYDPATQDGLPVDVYFTVFVNFRLH